MTALCRGDSYRRLEPKSLTAKAHGRQRNLRIPPDGRAQPGGPRTNIEGSTGTLGQYFSTSSWTSALRSLDTATR